MLLRHLLVAQSVEEKIGEQFSLRRFQFRQQLAQDRSHLLLFERGQWRICQDALGKLGVPRSEIDALRKD